MKQRNVGIRQHLLDLARQPNGFACTEVTAYPPEAASIQAWPMAKSGQIFRAKISHKVVRFFDTAARAAECERKHGRGVPAPVSGPAFEDHAQVVGEVTTSPDVVAKVTISKAPPGRFEVDPSTIVPGSFLEPLPPGRWSEYVNHR